MVQVTFTDNNKIIYDDKSFYQYDFGQELEIHGLTLPPTVQVHFARKNVPALINIGTTVDNVMTVLVPADTLKYAGEFTVYIYLSDITSGQTYKTITFYTRAREMPGDYAPPEEPNIIQQFMNKLDQIIDTGIASYTPDETVVNGMVDDYVKTNLITNSFAATVTGTALDAVKGKELQDGKLDKTGDSKDNVVTFTEALTEADIATGEKHSTMFGKILKSIKTFRTAIGTLANLSTTTKTSLVGAITEVNNNLAGTSGLKISRGRAVPDFNGTNATITLDKSFTTAITILQFVYNPSVSFNATVSGNVLTITSALTGSNTLDYLVVGT